MGEFNKKVDKTVDEIVEDYKTKAVQIMVDAFNQGYRMGIQQAEATFGEGGQNEN